MKKLKELLSAVLTICLITSLFIPAKAETINQMTTYQFTNLSNGLVMTINNNQVRITGSMYAGQFSELRVDTGSYAQVSVINKVATFNTTLQLKTTVAKSYISVYGKVNGATYYNEVLAVPYEVVGGMARFSKSAAEPSNVTILERLSVTDASLDGTLMEYGDVFDGFADYSAINAFAIELTKTATNDVQKATMIHDWIVGNVYYDQEALVSNEKYRLASKPLSVFTNKLAICSGYSSLAKVMFRAVGIPCVTV